MGKRVCVLGGDMRQATVSRLMLDSGYEVTNIGIEASGADLDVLKKCEILILPLPVSYDDVFVNAPLCDIKIKVSDVVDLIDKSCIVLGGCFSAKTKKALDEKKTRYYDYYEREELVIKNAIPTAEGAIGIAISELPITIFGCRALVVGYGRIGRALAVRLRSLGARVTVSARKYSDFAWIEESGMDYVHTGDLKYIADGFDLIINTVPVEVISRAVLDAVSPDALIIDLASKPGGVDFASAGELGKNVIWALSLPGKYSPNTSGRIIKDTIINILTEMEV